MWNQSSCRVFEHLPSQPSASVMTSTQMTNNLPAVGSGKGANWKSNEARRPKKFNCTTCNKWFTSSAFHTRHYSTAYHKSNEHKSRGHQDSANQPIRQPSPNHHGNQTLHSPLGHNPAAIAHGSLSSHNLTNLSNSNLPNGTAVLSNSTDHPFGTQSLNKAPMIPMDSSHFQMYPNGSSPRVMQVRTNNSLNITGESTGAKTIQPLPSFSHFKQAQRFKLTSANADVGGADPATGPYGFMVDTTAYDFPDYGTMLVSKPNDTLRYNNDEIIQSKTIPDSLPYHNNNRISTRNLQEFSDLSENCDPDGVRIASEVRKTQNNQTKSGYEDALVNSSTVSTTTTMQQAIYRCDGCNKVFNKICYLKQHNNTFHSGDKPFRCSRCGKRYASQELYEEHYAKHAGEKPHKCKICPSQFHHITDLRRHSCNHTGTKPHPCVTCGKGFIRKDHMIKHSKTYLKKWSNNSPKVTTVR